MRIIEDPGLTVHDSPLHLIPEKFGLQKIMLKIPFLSELCPITEVKWVAIGTSCYVSRLHSDDLLHSEAASFK